MINYFNNKMITVEVTNRCSAACIMCPREKMINDLESMTFGVWEKIIDESAELGIRYLDLCGYGDVFLDPDLFNKIEYARKRIPDLKIYISTTGIALNRKKWKFVIENVDILKFSIYGYNKSTYERVMKNVNYEKAYSNILGLLELNKQFHNKIYTIGNFILLKETKNEFQDWLNFWEPKLTEVYAWKPHNYIDGRNYREVKGKEQRTCGRPLEGPLNIAVNGEAHVCCFDYNKILGIGSVKNYSLTELVTSSKMKRIQDKHLNNEFSDLICQQCDQTVEDKSVLVYHNNKNRKVGMGAIGYVWNQLEEPGAHNEVL
jgi:hypothetical protein